MKSRVLAYVRIESRQGRLLVAQDEILGIGSGKDQVPLGTAEPLICFCLEQPSLQDWFRSRNRSLSDRRP